MKDKLQQKNFKICQAIKFILLASLFLCSIANAAESVDDAKFIRVGLVNVSESEQEVRNLHHKYSMEYFNELSKYVSYDYKFKTGTLEELQEKLKRGEIDLIGPVQYEPQSEMIFSNGELGYGIFGIYCRKDNQAALSLDSNAIKSMRLGMVESAELDDFLKFFLEENGWQVTVQKFTSAAEMMNFFRRGELDLIVDDGSHMTNSEVRLKPIGQIAEKFITTVEHKNLMDELNKTIRTNDIRYPFFKFQLTEKYFYQILQAVSPYYESEKKFIAESPPIKVAFLTPQEPLYNADKKNPRGIYIDYLNLISKESGLKFEFLEAKNDNELGSMLWSGKTDLAFVIHSIGNYSSTVFFTNEVAKELFVAVVPREKTDLSESPTVALIHTFNGAQSFWKEHNPNWKTKFFATVEDCLDAVESGDCEIAFVPAVILQRENIMVTHPSLTTDDDKNLNLSICFAISPNEPQMLQNVLNTAILHLDKKKMDMIVHKNSEPVISLNYALAAYPLPTAFAAFGLTGIIILSAALYFRNRTRKKQNQILSEKNMELETALRAVENMRLDRDHYRAESESDKLTQLYNKVTLEKICKAKLSELAEGNSALLFVIDLDHFKEANDTFGHQYGDRILVEFSIRLRHLFRSNDCVGRFGGDEFVVMLVGFITEEVIFHKAKMIQQIAKQLDIDGKVVGVTASIGIAITATKGEDYDLMFKQADKALYSVKENGRDGYCLKPPEVFH